MTATRASLAKAEYQRTRILRLHCQGKTQAEIAAALHLSPGNVSRHMAVIRADWERARDEGNQHFDSEQNEHLAKLECLYRESMQAWERSRQPAVDTSEEHQTDGPPVLDANGQPAPNAPGKRKTRNRQRFRDGDPRLLAQANDCLDKIAKIKGMYASEVRKGIEARAEKQRQYIHMALGNDHTRELLAQLTDAMGGMIGKAAAGGAAGAVAGQALADAAQPVPAPAASLTLPDDDQCVPACPPADASLTPAKR